MQMLRSLSPKLKRVAAALAAAGVVGVLTAASPALAHDGYGDGYRWRHHPHRYYAPRGYVYSPAPVYVPPRVYYAPPPVYAPPPGLSITIPFR